MPQRPPNSPESQRPSDRKAPESSSLLVGDAGDEVIRGHKYDGIREYDNPMPGWWVWLFIITIIFSVIYVLGIHVFDFVDTYEDDLAQAQAELFEIREAYAASGPAFETDERALARYVDDASFVEAGAPLYASTCASCHGNEGQGLIGPNLPDDYWLHGGTPSDVYRVIHEGVPTQGMPAWDGVLSLEEQAQVTAFVWSLHGTDPAGAKEPQGDLVERF